MVTPEAITIKSNDRDVVTVIQVTANIVAIELIMGREKREVDRENWGPHKIYGPSQEGKEGKASKKYKRRS